MLYEEICGDSELIIEEIRQFFLFVCLFICIFGDLNSMMFCENLVDMSKRIGEESGRMND